MSESAPDRIFANGAKLSAHRAELARLKNLANAERASARTCYATARDAMASMARHFDAEMGIHAAIRKELDALEDTLVTPDFTVTAPSNEEQRTSE